MSRGAKNFVEYNGIKFDSKLEADFYKKLVEKHGEEDVILQPKFELQEAFEKNGKKYRNMNYIGDFQIGNTVIDTKGFSDSIFNMKQKLFDYKYRELELLVVKEFPAYVRDFTGRFGVEKEVVRAEKLVKVYKKENNISRMTKKYSLSREFRGYFENEWNK